MKDARKIAPRPPGAVPYALASSSRRAKVSIACESCRSRRVKCDGVKPKCRSCSTQATDCVYATPTNHLAEQQKVKIEKLESDKSALYEILWYLQTKSPEQATALLAHLRCNRGNDVGATLQHFAEHRQGLSSMNTISESEANSSRSSSMPLASYNTEPLDLARLLDDRGLVRPDTAASLSTRTSYATVFDLKEPIDRFFNCVGALFYIMDKDEVQKNIESIRDFDMPLGDMVTMNVDARTTTTAAELAGMAAVGVVHSRLANPAAARQAELADYFYAVSKLGLDAAIEYNPLRAVKICALIAMYNVIVHASVALAYLGTLHANVLLDYLNLGISLSRRFGIDAPDRVPSMSAVDHDDMWRTYRTLVHMQCWLSASLDCLPIALGPAALEVKEDTGVAPADMIRRECVKVTIIKAEMLHRVPKTAPVPEDVVADFQQRLQTFVEQLPDWMGLVQLISNEQSEYMLQFRPVIFYVHLFYHSARMLLSRRLAIAYIPLDATSKVALPVKVQNGIRDGILAAQNNAVLMQSMLFEGKIVQVCWLCIFTAYTAGVMIAYAAAQKAIHGFPIAHDMELLNMCIKVLSYCSLKDAMACRFCNLLTSHLDELREVSLSKSLSDEETMSDEVALEDVLFDFGPGSTAIQDSARKLLNLIHRPFSGLGPISAHSTLSNPAETTMGTHLEWEWELKGDVRLNDMPESNESGQLNVSLNGAAGNLLSQPEDAAWHIWTPIVDS